MKILKVEAKNFSSYKILSFQPKPGLSVIYGPTGAGKSTLMDCISWTLYGKTAKQGTVDDVKSWTAGTEPTSSDLYLDLGQETIVVSRVRGYNSENDLYWRILTDESSNKIRGKDIKETQRLLESKILVSYDLYLTCCYFSEFSNTSSFYITTKAKQKELLENIVDLSLPITLEDAIKNKVSVHNKELKNKNATFAKLSGSLSSLKNSYERLKRECDNFETNKTNKLNELQIKLIAEKSLNSVKIIDYKVELDNIGLQLLDLKPKLHNITVCPTCGQEDFSGSNKNYELMVQLNIKKEKHEKEIEKLLQKNIIEQRISDLIDQTNPYIEVTKQEFASLANVQSDYWLVEGDILQLSKMIYELEYLREICIVLRSKLIEQSIKLVEFKTNYYLDKYFDSEFKITIVNEPNGEVDVQITKNGRECSYRQLSKGQRGLLKLCFSLAFMLQAENNLDVSSSVLFLDEPLDGLDVELKLKAYNLLDEIALQKETVLVIDHSVEFQNCFNSKFEVSLVNENSNIEEVK